MFIRSKIKKGCTYYQAVESYRDRATGRTCQRVLVDLGSCATVLAAFRKYEARYFAAREGKRREPFTAADRKAWARLEKLEWLLRKDKTSGYVRGATFQTELARWRRLRQSEQKAEEAAREEKSLKSFREFLAEEEAHERTLLAMLDLTPGASPDEITAAYRRKARECHPDHGGTDEAMARLTEAKDRLMEAS